MRRSGPWRGRSCLAARGTCGAPAWIRRRVGSLVRCQPWTAGFRGLTQRAPTLDAGRRRHGAAAKNSPPAPLPIR